MENKRWWLCRCDCGNEVVVCEDCLISGRITECDECAKKRKEEENNDSVACQIK